MLTKIKQTWNNMRAGSNIIPPPLLHSKPIPHNDKEITFACAGQEINKVILMLHSHAIWIGQNNMELEKFISGWGGGGVVRYRFKTTKDAIYFKLVWG